MIEKNEIRFCNYCGVSFENKDAIIKWDECTDNLLIICPVCKKSVGIYEED